MHPFIKVYLRFFLAPLALCLVGCIEVEENRRYDADGVAHLRAVIKVDPQYEALVFADFDKKLRAKLPKGSRIDSSQRIDGKAAFVIEADGAAAAEADADETQYPTTFAMSSGGFMQRRYDFQLSVAKALALPIPHHVRLTLPGTIRQTNGKKIADDTVEFDLTRARVGAVYSASSSAWAFNLGGMSSSIAEPGAARGPSWLLPASLASICAGIVALTVGWVVRNRRERMAKPVAQSALMPQQAAAAGAAGADEAGTSLFCTQCGSKNLSSRRFCSACGQALE